MNGVLRWIISGMQVFLPGKTLHESDVLDCHPLIREHFGEKLKQNNPEAWKEAHSRLYEYYKKQTKEYPDTIEEMLPLYRAVAHGCRAGRYQEVLDDVYIKRILRSSDHFSWKKLGTFGADLAAISGFFDSPWSQTVSELTENSKGFVLNQAGICLRALGRLKEAAQPMKSSIDATVAQKNWNNAARSAGNLSEIFLTMGDISQALDHAKQSVEFADRSGDAFQRMSKRTTLADVLHQAGRPAEAEALFQEAEEMQKKDQPEFPLLYSLGGFRYCDLLLGRDKYEEVLSRAEQTLEIVKTLRGTLSLLDIALDHLSLGRAHLLQSLHEGTGNFSKAAAEHLNQAVDWLRMAGTQDYLPCGLLARADLYIAQKDFEKARRDLDESMTIAERGEMGLYKADGRLGYARLYLATGEKEKARGELAIAKEMIGKMGYHRRDGEVKELQERLKL